MADLFAELHRRHPDVDLVILPPTAPPGDTPAATDDEVADTFSRVAWAGRQLWQGLAPDSAAEPQVRWSYAADPGQVRVVSRVVDQREDGLHLLVGLRDELESQGWEVTRPAGALEGLTGSLDGLHATASYAEPSGAFVLTLTGEPCVVGPERAASLVRGGR